MKISSIASTLVLSLAVAHATTTTTSTSSDYPGQCSATGGCGDYGTGYKCIAVDSSAAGLENLNMCIPGDACSGNAVGACPTFSAWPKAYRAVQPVCAFVPADNCKNTTAGAEVKNGTVDCYERNFTVGDTTKVLNGFYSCVDRAKYLTLNPTELNTTEMTELTSSIAKTCALNATANTICSGQGTCALTTATEQTFECLCNKGYETYTNCSTVSSNECSSLGQCGTEGTCIMETGETGETTGTCTCAEGTKGNQCTQCDSASAKACNAHGTCSTAGVCTCSTGYSGTFCSDADATPAPATTKPGTTTTPTTTASLAPANLPPMLPTLVATAMAAVAVAAMVVG